MICDLDLSDIVERKEVYLSQASRSIICRSCKVDRPITEGLYILICIWILVMGYHWKR